jgi:murein DD-endopeptidase MepM/ murein hydrolase activator NlpD
VLLGPTVVAVVLTLLTTSTATACGPTVTGVPESLDARTADGAAVPLDKIQLAHAATIVEVGSMIEGVGRDGIVVALMAALTESRLRMLANSTAYPESANYPNDGDGSDHDSLGLFQMRPAAGWGPIDELMDPTYQAAAFYGGPDGPNHGSPRGLLDIPHWKSLPKGAAAQAVEVSAYPDRYAAYEPVAEAILAALTSPRRPAKAAGPSPAVAAPHDTTRVVFPLPGGTWTWTSGFGYRVHPVLGTRLLHAGVDYAAPVGTPVLAAADGVVHEVSWSARSGNLIVLDHVVGSRPVATAYAHLLDGSVIVHDGDRVAASQQIASVGATGAATGPHLHFEVHPGGFYSPVDPEPWLTEHAPDRLVEAAVGPQQTCRFLTNLSERMSDPTASRESAARLPRHARWPRPRAPHLRGERQNGETR